MSRKPTGGNWLLVSLAVLALAGILIIPAFAQIDEEPPIQIRQSVGSVGIRVIPPRVYGHPTPQGVEWCYILILEENYGTPTNIAGGNRAFYAGNAVMEQTFFTGASLLAHFFEHRINLGAKERVTWLVQDRFPAGKSLPDRVVYAFGLEEPGKERYSRELNLPLRSFVQKTACRLPFDGTWYVRNGHESILHNHYGLENIPSEGFAWDFTRLGENGLAHTGNSGGNEGYFAFAQAVVAVADGKVAALCDNRPDHSPSSAPGQGMSAAERLGNYVVIDHGNNLHSLVAHLKQGSIKVAVGETVKVGQTIGQCGNSGDSTIPQIHLQFMDGPEYQTASGVPARFHHFTLHLGPGMVLQNADPLTGWAISQN